MGLILLLQVALMCEEVSTSSVRLPSGVEFRVLDREPGAAQRGAVLLVDGIPPSETGDPLALADHLCRAGWRVLTFQPPGSWESEGIFGLGTAETAISVLAEIGSVSAVVGHSAGGLMVLSSVPDLKSVRCIAVSSTANGALMSEALKGDEEFRRQFEAEFERRMALAGDARTVGGRAFVDELIAREERLAFDALARSLASHRLLVLGAEADVEVPLSIHFAPFIAELRESTVDWGARRLRGGHNFEDSREGYYGAIEVWLAEACS